MRKSTKMMMMCNKHRKMGIEYEDYPENRVRPYYYENDSYPRSYENGAENYWRPYSQDRQNGMEDYWREYPPYGYVPQNGAESRRYSNGRFAPKNGGGRMNPIGFRMDEPRNHGDYYVGDKQRGRREKTMGRAGSTDCGEFTRETAENWMNRLQNEDGSIGEHWTMQQINKVMEQYHITDCDPVEFYAAMNMLYSDYCKVFEKFGVSDTELYADMAKAFLCDKDAMPHKLMNYYCCIVKR